MRRRFLQVRRCWCEGEAVVLQRARLTRHQATHKKHAGRRTCSRQERARHQHLLAIARMQQCINLVPCADRKDRDAALFIIDVVRKPELRRCDLDLVDVLQPMQSIPGKTRIDHPLFPKFLREALLHGFIQLALLLLGVGVDGKFIAYRA